MTLSDLFVDLKEPLKVEARLAAILAADVVDYSKLMGADQAATLSALRSLRTELINPAVVRHNGETVKSMGDGWFVAFASVGNAVQCAIDIQEGISDVAALHLRIGIHLGDIVQEDEDLFGDGVNIAARLQGVAAPDDILISDVVHHSLDGRLGGLFHRKPPLKLKNIERDLVSFSWRNTPVNGQEPADVDRGEQPSNGTENRNAETKTAKPHQQKIRIGFLELELKAGDEDAKLLCEGVSDALRVALANQAGLSLVTDLVQADMLVEGAMQVRGARYRANIRLQDQVNKEQIKAEKFDGVIADLFDAEDELALRICTAVRFAAFAYEAAIQEETDLPIDQQNSGAIRVHAGGLLSDIKYDEWVEARRLLEIVLDRDPDDASALAMAGMSCSVEPNCGWRSPAAGTSDVAMDYLKRATRLNPTSDFAQANLALAQLELAEDHTAALFTSEQLLTKAPHYAQGQMAHSAVLSYSGQAEEGVELALKAIEPLKSLRLFSQNAAYLMIALFLCRRFEEVLHWGHLVDQRVENVPRNLILMIAAAAHSGDQTATHGYHKRLLETQPDFNLSEMRVWPLKRLEDWHLIQSGLGLAGLPDLAPSDR